MNLGSAERVSLRASIYIIAIIIILEKHRLSLGSSFPPCGSNPIPIIPLQDKQQLKTPL